MIDRLADLRLFVAIVERGSLSAAADALGLSPGAVSQRLAALEQTLGTQLLRRTTRRSQLTDAGNRFHDTARRVLAELDDLGESLAAEQGTLRGPVRVTAPLDLGRNHVAPVLDAFVDAHPGVSASLVLSDTALDLAQNNIDIAIRYGRLPDSALQLRRISTNRRFPVASPAYLDKAGRPAKPQDLHAFNCMPLLRGEGRFDLWPFVADGVLTEVKVVGDREANDGDLLRRWAVEGRGIVLKSAWDVVADIETGLLEPLLTTFCPPDVDLQIVLPAMKQRPRRVIALVEHLSAALRKLDERLKRLGIESAAVAL
ncbi:MAG: LysR family transcriptional regulator [Proteobacteria bacterium]|nr:LysR family transcriptional regulator [Pseudomonadota bacterium]